MSIPAAQPADLLAEAYERHAAAVLDYAAGELAGSGLHRVEDVASEVWLRLTEHAAIAGLPADEEALLELLEEMVAVAASEQITVSVREVSSETVVPAASPLAGVPRRMLPVSRIDYAHGAFYIAGAIDGPGVVVTQRGHWYATYDARNAQNNKVCRGCGVDGHFEYILDSRGGSDGCPATATAAHIRDALWVTAETPVELPRIQSPALTAA
jgi:hypothetical protein